jgi:uncharacterized delta-60 repeat protein
LGNDFALVRYGTDGKLDSDFGSGGKVSTDFFGGGDDAIISLNITPGGKIIAAGTASRPSSFVVELALARYDTNGSLDPTFGSGGKLTAPLPLNFGGLYALAFQPDGKVVTASVSRSNFEDFGVARYNPDGTLDSSFGSGGSATTDFAGKFDAPLAIAVQRDGKTVVAGGAETGLNRVFAILRYRGDVLTPRITSASVSGKKLFVLGENFDSGAVILLNGDDQKTVPDDQNPTTRLIGKKAGKKISPGDKLRVRNSDGVLSPEFTFTG